MLGQGMLGQGFGQGGGAKRKGNQNQIFAQKKATRSCSKWM